MLRSRERLFVRQVTATRFTSLAWRPKRHQTRPQMLIDRANGQLLAV